MHSSHAVKSLETEKETEKGPVKSLKFLTSFDVEISLMILDLIKMLLPTSYHITFMFFLSLPTFTPQFHKENRLEDLTKDKKDTRDLPVCSKVVNVKL